MKRNPEPTSLAASVRGGRKKVGITQDQLAERLGISRFYVGRIENGVVPSEELLDKIDAELALGLTPDDKMEILSSPAGEDAPMNAIERALLNAFRKHDRGQVLSLIRRHLPS